MQINIGNTIINFPSSSANPNWAGQVILFAQAVESALSQIVGAYDIPQRTMDLNGKFNTSTQDVTDEFVPLQFSGTAVRAAFIKYSIQATSGLNYIAEAGTMTAVYTGSDWVITNEFVGSNSNGDTLGANVTFSITATGQVQFKFNSPLTGTPTGKLLYSAQTLSI